MPAAAGESHQPRGLDVNLQVAQREPSSVFSISPSNVLSQHRPMLPGELAAQHRPMLASSNFMPPPALPPAQPSSAVVPYSTSLPTTTTTSSPYLWSQAYHYFDNPYQSYTWPTTCYASSITTSTFSAAPVSSLAPPIDSHPSPKVQFPPSPATQAAAMPQAPSWNYSYNFSPFPSSSRNPYPFYAHPFTAADSLGPSRYNYGMNCHAPSGGAPLLFSPPF